MGGIGTAARAVAAVGALLVAAPVAACAPAAAGPPAPAWTACTGAGAAAGMECATIEVPVDWARPEGRTLALPLARLPGTDPARRIGVVFAIPGGPGGSGVAELQRAAPHYAALRERFDVVTFDPRNAVRGLPPACLEPGPVQVAPATRAQFDAQAAGNRAVLRRCQDGDPELVGHLDSTAVARDVDAVRAALGERQLSLVGSSYGGVPAAAHARLFPHRTRAVFLDGAVPHATPVELEEPTHRSAEENFARFTTWCAGEPACPLHGEDVPAVWQGLLAAADRTPVPVPGAGPGAAFSRFDLVFHSTFFVTFGRWAEFAAAVDLARRGDASGFTGGRPLPKQPMFPGGSAVHCQDGLGYRGYDEYERAEQRGRARSANFAGLAHALNLPCSGWDGPVADPPAPLPVDDLPPFLGAGSWGDGGITAAAVGRVPGSVVVRYDGPGHVLYQSGVRCVIEHADRYLVDLVLPAPGTTCR